MSIIISQSNASGTSRVRPVIEAARSMCPTKGAAVNARSQVTARPAGEALFDPRRRRTQMRFPAAARPRVRRVRTVPVPGPPRSAAAAAPGCHPARYSDPRSQRVGHPVLLESVAAQLIGQAADVGDEPGTEMVDHQLGQDRRVAVTDEIVRPAQRVKTGVTDRRGVADVVHPCAAMSRCS